MLPTHEQDALLSALQARGVEGPCVEIGTAYARTLIDLLQRCTPPEPRFLVIDPMTWFPDQDRKVRDNLTEAGFGPPRVEVLPMTSAAALRRPFPELAFVFVDGDHSMRGVTTDLQWARRVRAGGVLAFHDYGPGSPGVVAALDRFLARHRHYRREALVGTLLVVRKLSESTGAEVTRWDRLRAALGTVFFRLRRSVRKRWPRRG